MQVDYGAVYNAWLAFKKGKSPTSSIDEFTYDLENNLIDLTGELINKSYRHGSYSPILLQDWCLRPEIRRKIFLKKF